MLFWCLYNIFNVLVSKLVYIFHKNKTMNEKYIQVYLIQKYIKDILKCLTDIYDSEL